MPAVRVRCALGRVDRVVYAVDWHDAARGGFDDREFYGLFTRGRESWAMPVQALAMPNRVEPFDTWLAHPGRVRYPRPRQI
jgi:guanine deaminase